MVTASPDHDMVDGLIAASRAPRVMKDTELANTLLKILLTGASRASSPPAEHRMPHVNRCRGLNLKALRSSHAVNLRALKSHWALIGLSMRAPRVHGFVRFCF